MKFTIFAFFVVIAVIQAGPVSINGNNVGDIVTVGVNADVSLSNNANVNVITAVLALLNQQLAIINSQPTGAEQPISDVSSFTTPELDNETVYFKFIPALIDMLKNIKVTPEMIDEIKKLLKKE